MRRFRSGLVTTAFLAATLAMASTLAYAQGGAVTTTLSGVVADASQAVIPGADVSVKDNARLAHPQF